jgi:hypothetical protein
MVNVHLPHQARRGVAIVDAELAARAIAVGVHRGLRHAQSAGDLLRRQMLVHQPQALAFPRREQAHRIGGDIRLRSHVSPTINRAAGLPSTFPKSAWPFSDCSAV